jgi:hypothetical protein
MPKVVIDAHLAEQLRQATGPVLLCDEAGKVVGQFAPPSWDSLTPGVDEAELQQRFASDERRYSTAEVLELLLRRGEAS